MSRSDNVKLPDRVELTEILKAEVRRQIPIGKENFHYPQFDTVIELFRSYSLPTDLFTDDSLDVYQVVANGAVLLNEAVEKILGKKPNINQIELLGDAYDYLSEEDRPHKSDLIFVFGGKTDLRALKAAELYKKKLSKNILISGGYPVYGDKSGPTEAERYKQILVDNGVSDKFIMTENEAITLPDNVWRSINYIEENDIVCDSMTLVNSPYSQRRGWAIFKKFFPDSVKVYRVNSDTQEKFKRKNWFKQEDTLRVVLNEFIKMRASVVYNTA